jgi:hypothetical protein
MMFYPLIPAKAGTQVFCVSADERLGGCGLVAATDKKAWVPAFAGKTGAVV